MRDRMSEFKGSSVAPDQCINIGNNGSKNSEDMNSFLSKVEVLKTSIAVIKQKIENMEQLYTNSLDAISEVQTKQCSSILNNEMDEIEKQTKDIQTQILKIDKENKELEKKAPSSDLRIRQTQQITLTKLFMDTMNKYRDIQTKYQRKYKERMEKQYTIVNPNTSEKEIARMLESGEAIGNVFAQELVDKNSKTAEARTALQEIKDRHQDLIRIEKTVLELQQLFIDMAVLVNSQGEVLNQIESQINATNDNAEKAVEELKEAVNYQVI